MKKMIQYFTATLSLLFSFCWSISVTAQQTPGAPQSQSILIKGARAHIGDGQIIENSALGFAAGKIIEITTADQVQNSYDQVIDASGKELYPGFIALNATLGLVEIDAVRPTNDLDELGEFIPHIRSIIAYNAESKVVESVRPNGILTAQICPRGGSISGKSSIVQLDAWNWEDAALKMDEGIHMNWPSPYQAGRWWLGEDPTLKANKKYTEQVQKIRNFFQQSKAYLQKNQATTNIPFEAMRSVFKGDTKIYVHASQEKQIVDAIVFLQEFDLSQIVLVGGEDAITQVDFLKKHQIPVLINHPHTLPKGEDDDPKTTFKRAAELHDAGLLVSIDVRGRMERMNTRNLPFYAGSFAAYGLEKEEAVQMITLNAAKIIGMEDQIGSLAIGKDATFFLSEGDALDMRTNLLMSAYIQGRVLSLETHQTKLWKRYLPKVTSNN